MKKLLLSLISAVALGFTAKADQTVTLDFTGWNFPGASDWTSSYQEHVVAFENATVTFAKADRQNEGNTIDNCPVTKGYDITVTSEQQIVSTSVLLKQWGTKTKTASINVNDAEVATTSEFAFDSVAIGANTYVIKFTEANNQVGLQTITLVLSGDAPVVTVEAPVITPASGTYSDPQTVTITAAEGNSIYYTLDGTTPDDAVGILYEAPFTVTATTTVKAIAYDNNDACSAVTTSNIVISKSIANTIETAYTTAEAIALIDDPSSNLSDTVYVKGIVSNVDSYNTKYKSLTYWLDNKTFEVYSGYGLNKDSIESEDYLVAGDTVIVCGKIKKYNSTYEFDKNNYLVYIGKAPAPVVDIANTPETAYTVAEANAIIAAGEDLDTKVYVKGTISKIKEVSLSYGNATYFISDDGTTTDQLEVYRGYSIGGNKFQSEDEIKVGDQVIVYGKLVDYNGTYEFSTGSQIYSINGSTSVIRRVETESAIDLSTAEIFNICGQRVTDMSRKGIYIVNGKKVVVK